MNKILVIKQDVYGNFNNKQRLEVAKNIADTWNETGIIAIPPYFDYEFIDCDKFMGVTIDKDIANERFENGCFEEPRHNPWNVQTVTLKNVDTCTLTEE